MRKPAPLGRLTLLAPLCAVLAAATPALAGSCGDDVSGERVACACGDVAISDTTLRPTDPVVTETCPDDGLTLLASPEADGITLNLAGQSITGSGNGTGIRVARGGRHGAVILGGEEGDTRAEVARFGTGIRASGRSVLAEVRSIDVHDNVRDGLDVHAGGVRLEDVRSENNGRDGIALSGHGNEVQGVTARNNAGDGLEVRGSGHTVDADTTGNRGHGAVIGGRGHRVNDLVTAGNGGAGVLATGNDHELGSVKSHENAGGRIADPRGATK